MRRLITAVFGALCIGCASEATQSVPENAAMTVSANVASTNVASVVVQVTGPGIPDTLVFNLTVTNGQASGTIAVPAGSARQIVLRAFDENGIETYRGAVTVDIQSGTNPTATVTLNPLSGNQPIMAIIGSVVVTVSPESQTVAVGDTLRLAAVVTDSAGHLLNVRVAWASTNPGIVSVDTGGLLMAHHEGVASVVAVYGRVAASSRIVVSPSWVSIAGITTANLQDVWSSAPNDVWITGEGGTLLHFTSGGWDTIPPFTSLALTGIWSFGTGNIWSAAYHVGGGGGALFHSNGASWTPDTVVVPPNVALGPVFGFAANDIWTGGDAGFMLHFDGATWVQIATNASSAVDEIFGTATADVWAVMSDGGVLHYDGAQWTAASSPPSPRLWGVWAARPSEAWAAGDNGTLLHWNGTSWSAVTSPTTRALRAVWGSSDADVWVVGAGGTILHYDGRVWSTVTSPTTSDLRSVVGVDSSHVWAVGDGGTILRLTGTSS